VAVRLTLDPGLTEITKMANRGHALVIDSGWREVADTAVGFVRRFVK
jgi:non-heme chloroperoxidase